MSRNGFELKSEQGRQDALSLTHYKNLEIVAIMTNYVVEDQQM